MPRGTSLLPLLPGPGPVQQTPKPAAAHQALVGPQAESHHGSGHGTKLDRGESGKANQEQVAQSNQRKMDEIDPVGGVCQKAATRASPAGTTVGPGPAGQTGPTMPAGHREFPGPDARTRSACPRDSFARAVRCPETTADRATGGRRTRERRSRPGPCGGVPARLRQERNSRNRPGATDRGRRNCGSGTRLPEREPR